MPDKELPNKKTTQAAESGTEIIAKPDEAEGKLLPPPPPPSEMYRFSVNLAADSAAILRETAARKGFTVTDAFRRAVAIMGGVDEQLLAGRDLEFIDPVTGDRTKIVFL